MNYTAKDIEKAKELKAEGYNWIATDRNGDCCVYETKPYRFNDYDEATGLWSNEEDTDWKYLLNCYFKLITWKSEPVSLDDIIASGELKED